MVTALVDNVCRHTDSSFALRLESTGEEVTVAVQDNCKNLPARREMSAGSARPTGLGMVAAVARAWGTAPLPGGKVVWAVIDGENRL